MHSFSVANVTSEAAAAPIVEALNGKTYMRFNLRVCPAYGGFDVVAETDHDGTREEAMEMFMFLMASTIRQQGETIARLTK